jgi:hypothetical protein
VASPPPPHPCVTRRRPMNTAPEITSLATRVAEIFPAAVMVARPPAPHAAHLLADGGGQIGGNSTRSVAKAGDAR